jgi:hypothetical protein
VIPTAEQLFTCYVLTAWATKMYLPVYLVRMDERSQKVFFMAGEENHISISRNGIWRYV